ncbi:sulfite exporter TauE/SafE family protein [Magnetofaba australis]|uniref:Probable membrane transporter protein n=1 Tax=Magnetofaba australis IT-1 TaxID=1434232 RepID=A0A1Y2K6A8_9PROT|nr:sulfite exporter TauE/SafE family protein [Magnetofaba australis]OSM05060.1 hypothetical protein MAIT1_03195 [Magnetofaba australis IT-1]
MMLFLLGAAATGLFAGVIAGLFGVGGGVIIVPALLALYTWRGVDASIMMQLAVGTSLATIVITNLSAVWHHHKRGAVRWDLATWFVPGVLLGALGGAVAAAHIDGAALKTAFGAFVGIIGVKMLLNIGENGRVTWRPSAWAQSALGGVIGGVSALFGIGGGTMSVPTLTILMRASMREAVATSSALGVGIALLGAMAFMQQGWDAAALPPGSWGYVSWLTGLGVVAGTLITTPVGVKLAHKLDQTLLKRAFGVLLVIMSYKLMFA